MAVTYVGVGSYQQGANVTSQTYALPAGVADGDLLLMSVTTTGNTWNANAGWTEISNTPQGSPRGMLFWRKYATGDPSPGITISSGSTHASGCVAAFRGVAVAPLNYSHYRGTADPLVSPDLTPTLSTMVAIYHFSTVGGLGTLVEGGSTERFSYTGGLTNDGLAMTTVDGTAGAAIGTWSRDVVGGPSETSIAVQLDVPSSLTANRMKVRTSTRNQA